LDLVVLLVLLVLEGLMDLEDLVHLQVQWDLLVLLHLKILMYQTNL
jgi:hypothetical protein